MNNPKNQIIIGGIVGLLIVIGITFILLRNTAEAPEESATQNTQGEIATSTDSTGDVTENPTQNTNTQTNSGSTSSGTQTNTNTQSQNKGENPPPDEKLYKLVTYTDAGFSPKILTIKKGDTVFFWNKGSSYLWVSSNEAACSGDRTGLFDTCGDIAAGNGWTYTFSETGTYTYKDHYRTGLTGTIIVQ